MEPGNILMEGSRLVSNLMEGRKERRIKITTNNNKSESILGIINSDVVVRKCHYLTIGEICFKHVN